MIQWLNSEIGVRLCQTLLHSIWQGALLAAVVCLLGYMLRSRKIEWAYWLNVFALMAALIAMPITFLMVNQDPITSVEVNQTAQVGPVAAPDVSVEAATAKDAGSTAIIPSAMSGAAANFNSSQAEGNAALSETASNTVTARTLWAAVSNWVVGIYLIGVCLMMLRLVVSVVRTNRLAHCGQQITDGPAFQILQRLAAAWSMKAMPAIRLVEEIVTPKVVGLFRPTILLPTSAITGLTVSEIEMILAHELAHVRRHDMWVNLVQRLAETVLFFNPALWYLSRRISRLREYCCDEMACDSNDSAASDEELRVRYAETLLRVLDLSSPSSERISEVAALAASGRSPSELRQRVARLFGEPLREPLRLTRGGVLLVIGFAMLLISPALWSAQAQDAAPTAAEIVLENDFVAQAEDASETAAKIVLEDDFVAQATNILRKALSEKASTLPFLQEEYIAETCQAFSDSISGSLLTLNIDLSDTSDKRKVAILASLQDKGHQYLGLAVRRADMTSLNQCYLGFPDRVKTLQWKILMALKRGELTMEDEVNRAEQRAWMARALSNLKAKDDSFQPTLERTVRALKLLLDDPLVAIFDQPMSPEQFDRYKEEIEQLNVAPIYFASYFQSIAPSVLWDNEYPQVLDGEKVGGWGTAGHHGHGVSLSFMSNRAYKPGLRGYSSGDWIKIGSRRIATPGKTGEARFDNKQLVARQGAKLLRLDVNNWYAADQISDADLRKQLETNGVTEISLDKECLAVETDWSAFRKSGGSYLGLLTSTGQLCVINVSDCRSGFDLTTRIRAK